MDDEPVGSAPPADPKREAERRRIQLRWQASRVFSPGAPIEKYSLFAGRTEQVEQVIQSIMSRGQHIILYGERDVDKTSLVKVLSELLSGFKMKVLESGSVNCDVKDEFSSL